MKVIFLLGLLFLTSCGSDDDGGLEPEEQQEDSLEKNLFSLWKNREDDSNFDLTNMSFETPANTDFVLSTGETCSCSVFLSGSQNTGTMEVFNCVYIEGGMGDPDCDALWENGRQAYEYINSDRILELCKVPGSCETYR